jgi:hypothetical protein
MTQFRRLDCRVKPGNDDGCGVNPTGNALDKGGRHANGEGAFRVSARNFSLRHSIFVISHSHALIHAARLNGCLTGSEEAAAPGRCVMLLVTASSSAVVLMIVLATAGAVMLLIWNPEAGYASRETTWP